MTIAKAAIAVGVVAMLSLAVRPVSADRYTDAIHARQHAIAANKAKIAAAQHDAALRLTLENQLKSELHATDADIAVKTAQVNATSATLDTIKRNLRVTRARLAAAQRQLAADKDRLAHQLVTMYELQQQSTTLNNLLTSGNFNQFFTSLLETRRISAMENHEVDQINTERAHIQTDVDSIAAQQQQQQHMLDVFTAQQQALAEDRAEQREELRTQQVLQAQDAAEVQSWQAANAQAQAAIRRLNALEQAALAAGGGHGDFGWPDTGAITQTFGCTPFTFEMWDENCSTRHFHTGLDIAGPCGEPIRAADAGLAYRQPFQSDGYGNYIIIVHGNGWETLYGHMWTFAVGSGATVHRGQVIGYEGSTGNSTGCHLHFGISHNGNWVNPLTFLG